MEAKPPSRLWYWVSIIIFVFSLTGYIVSFLHFTNKFDTHFKQDVFPGRKVFPLEKTGTYYIFYEYVSTFNGQHFSTPETLSTEFAVQICNAEKERQIEFKPIESGTITYQTNSRKAFAIGSFVVPEPGKYAIEMKYATNHQKPMVVLAVGQSPLVTIFVTLVILLFLFLIGFLSAAALMIFVYIKRKKMVHKAFCGEG